MSRAPAVPRRGLACALLLALALLGAQALGLAHRVLHGGAAAQVAADLFGHAGDDEVACPLYDQLAGSAGLLDSTPAAALPPAVARDGAVPPARVASRRPAAAFDARAPPFGSA